MNCATSCINVAVGGGGGGGMTVLQSDILYFFNLLLSRPLAVSETKSLQQCMCVPVFVHLSGFVRTKTLYLFNNLTHNFVLPNEWKCHLNFLFRYHT